MAESHTLRSRSSDRIPDTGCMIARTLDLFCGAGGSSLGAFRAGTEILLGVDEWPKAIETYKENFDGRGLRLEMTARTRAKHLGLERGDIDLLLASPECTNHTCAKGKAKRDEESRRTANYVLNIAKDLQPRWIVIENVVHMKQWKGYEPLIKRLENLFGKNDGYGVTVQTLDASDFGVPQTRRRLFLICDREGKPQPVPIPNRTAPTVQEILDLRHAEEGGPFTSLPIKGRNRPLAKATLERFKRGLKAVGHEPFLIVYYGSDAAGGWQDLDRPLRTITTLDRFGLVTWRGEEPYLRMLQVPELMKAMGFGDAESHKLQGTRREKIMQLGNGVCPPVMQAVVEHLVPRSMRRT